MIGGMIGNNSSGSFSVKYHTTREHVHAIRAILSDGSEALFRPLSTPELEQKKHQPGLEGDIYREMVRLLETYQDLIRQSYPHPDVRRRNTGYALDKLLDMEPFTPGGAPFNLCALLCGSEGTLALTAEATLRLVPLPSKKILLIPQFDSLDDALQATREAVKWDIAAGELLDHHVLNATKGNIEQKRNRFFLEGDPKSLLIIQMEGDNAEELRARATELADHLRDSGLGYTHPVIENPELMKRVWDLRKAGLGLLMGLGSESRSPSFVEDTAVRVQDLPEYARDFQSILDRHGLPCVYYAHASVGELHLRPMIDTTTEDGVRLMKTVAQDVAELVKTYRGSLSGEHGDGRVRAPFLETVLGPAMIPVLRRVKEIWDPENLFNPGKIVDPKPMEADLRYSPAYRAPDLQTAFHWRDTQGFDNALSLCNGAGVCRKLASSGGTMCPSYHATLEEKDNTRGRANLFRQLFEGEGADAFGSEELKEALDLCLSCKACKSECPASVDMARMKAEFTHGWHQSKGISLADRFFGQPEKLYPAASLFAPIVNKMNRSSIGKKLLSGLMGVDSRRPLPLFAETTFMQQYRNTLRQKTPAATLSKTPSDAPAKDVSTTHRTSTTNPSKPTAYGRSTGRPQVPQVVLLVDIFTNQHEPHIAADALQLLRSFGIEPEIPGVYPTGRPQLSRGLLSQAKTLCHNLVRTLTPYAEKGYFIVGLEPSELLTLRDEYLDLCDESMLPHAKTLASRSFLLEEFLLDNLYLLDNIHLANNLHLPNSLHLSDEHSPSKSATQKVVIHNHCHTKALAGGDTLLQLLRHLGLSAEELQTGCCGMAGSFGYDQNKYEVSMAIGEQTLFPALRETSPDTNICAPGFSCRHQISDGLGKKAAHPATLLRELLCPDVKD